MAKYRKVDPRIWNDAKFRDLSDNGKLVFFFLLTHPNMTSIGAMRHSIPGMAAELGWEVEVFGKAFAEPFRKGLVKHDEKASFVWLPNFIKYNPPENPNVVKSWDAAVDLLPECDMLCELLRHVKEFLKELPEPFRKPFRKGLANQEQEQEQEQNKESLPEKPETGSHGGEYSLPCEDGTEYTYPEKYLTAARKAYPLVDIPLQIVRARAWLESNPTKKKTRRGMTRFLNSWLADKQQRAEASQAQGALPITTGGDITPEQRLPAKWLREAKI